MIWTYNAEVRLFLETECLPEEAEAFFTMLEAILEDPIGNSTLWLGKSNRPYAVRFFRFGGCRAFFEYHWTGEEHRDWIRIITCQRSKPRTAD